MCQVCEVVEQIVDPIQSAIEELLGRGKKRGYVTWEEMNEILPDDAIDPAQLELIMLHLEDISVITDASIACGTVEVHSLHDVTEGGLATGLREVAAASGLGLAIEEGSVPILPETAEICRALGLDPLGLLASGALLITLPSGDVPRLLSELQQGGVAGFEIGTMMEQQEGLVLFSRQGEEIELPEFRRDEVARYFATAG